MKKYTLSAEICRLPVVNMMTGRILARSFTPFFDKETLVLKYLALNKDDSGYDRVLVPFSSLCFINDVCTMIRLPDKPFLPDETGASELIGAPLTARVGAIALFNFGSIAKAEVEESGEIISVTLNDGHTFLIPGADSPEKASVNEAFASEAFRCMNGSVRVSPEIISVTSRDNAYSFAEPQSAVQSAGADYREETQVRPEPVRRAEPVYKEAVREQPAAQAFVTPEVPAEPEKPAKKAEPTVKKSTSQKSKTKKLFGTAKKRAAAKAKSKAKESARKETEEKTEAGGRSKFVTRLLAYIPPVTAMLIFFFLYFFFFNFFIK